MCDGKYHVVQRFIPIVCNNHFQLFAYAVCVKFNGQMDIYATHFYILWLPENFVRYSFLAYQTEFSVVFIGARKSHLTCVHLGGVRCVSCFE